MSTKANSKLEPTTNNRVLTWPVAMLDRIKTSTLSQSIIRYYQLNENKEQTMSNLISVDDQTYIVFGDHNEWAISEDDHCLRFHPQFNIDPTKTSTWIWREAWLQVKQLGGFDAVIKMLTDATN